jgi:glycosyltransferase involved in cell wall biosynthesis
VGRLEDEKNYAAIIEAIGMLKGKKPGLTLIGQGSKSDALAALAKRCKVDLTIKPTLPYTEIAAEYQRADLFVLPSLSEGQPKVLLEAMGCALPCIASPCEGNKQLIFHEKNGLLATGFAAEDFVAALTAFIEDGALRQRMGKAARADVLEHYDIAKNVGREIELLTTLAKSTKRHPKENFS